MALKATNGIDLVGAQLENARVHNLASNPANPGLGRLLYNTSDNFIYYFDGTAFRQFCHISQVMALRLDQFAAPNAAVSMNGQRITGVADPIGLADAANKGYVDAAVAGMKWKDAVRFASTASITLAGLGAVDGFTPVAGDRVARLDNSALAGIYVASAGAWVRSNDADMGSEMVGAAFFVSEGTTNGNKLFVCTSDAPITLGTTALTFAQIGAGTTLTPGPGILIPGSTIQIDTAVVGRKTATFLVGNGSATSFTLTHNFGPGIAAPRVREVANGAGWWPDYTSNATTCTLIFSFAPTTNQFEVVLVG